MRLCYQIHRLLQHELIENILKIKWQFNLFIVPAALVSKFWKILDKNTRKIETTEVNYQRKVIEKQSVWKLARTACKDTNKNTKENNILSKIEVSFFHKTTVKMGSLQKRWRLLGPQAPRPRNTCCLRDFRRRIHYPLWYQSSSSYTHIPGNKMQKGEHSLKLHTSHVFTSL